MGSPDRPAGELVAAVVDDLAVRIAERTPAAVDDEPDAVHQLRTAVRRLRNVLAAFSDLLHPGPVGALRADLSTYGDRLGRARDLEVRTAQCAAVADELGLDPAARHALVGPLHDAHRRAHADLVAWCRSEEALWLIAALRDWAARPALAAHAARPAAVVAREVLLAQARRALAHQADYRTDTDSAHALRKAARRLRHVADAVTEPPGDVLGEQAAELGAAGARVQARLGDHRDALLLAEHVRDRLDDAGAHAASYQLVIEHAQRASVDAIEQVPNALERLRRALSEAAL